MTNTERRHYVRMLIELEGRVQTPSQEFSVLTEEISPSGAKLCVTGKDFALPNEKAELNMTFETTYGNLQATGEVTRRITAGDKTILAVRFKPLSESSLRVFSDLAAN